MNSIKDQMISGVIWMAISRYAALLIQLIVTIIISRILNPADYGLIGLLYIFIAISSIILDSGFGQALIQKGNATDIDFSSVFFVNLILGGILYLLLFFSSSYIAYLYNLPELEKLAKIIFLIIPINSFGLIHNTMLEKDMKFKRISAVTITSVIISGVAGIFFAYNGYGVLALVYQTIILNIVKTFLLIIQNLWMPLFSFSISSIKTLLPLSLNLLGTGFIIVLFNNIYTLLIGKLYTASDVGYYNQAKRFADISGDTITGIIFSVSFPALVKLKNEPAKLKHGYNKIINLTIFIIAPIMLGLIVIGENLFSIVLTEKWLPSVPYFKLLCLYGLTFPLHQINTNILKVLNKGKQILLIEILRRLLLIIAILFTINSGISNLLIGQITATFIIMLANMYYTGRAINFSLIHQAIQITPYYLIAGISYLIVFSISNIFDTKIYNLLFHLSFFTFIYLAINSLFKLSAYTDIIHIIKGRIQLMKA